MTWNEIRERWGDLQKHAKQAWPALHPAELEIIDGDRDRLIDKVRDAQSMSHEAAAKEVEAWRRHLS